MSGTALGAVEMQIDIIRLAEIIGALSVIFGVIIGVFKKIEKNSARLEKIENRVTALEQETSKIKREDELIIFSLRACLDGLRQQGCNGKVTEAIEAIDQFIIESAHD